MITDPLEIARNANRRCDELITVGFAVLDAARFTTINSDRDELEGCKLCEHDRPFTHRDDCVIPHLEYALRLRRQKPAGYIGDEE